MMQMVTLFREVWSENEPWQWLTAAATALVVLVIALGLRRWVRRHYEQFAATERTELMEVPLEIASKTSGGFLLVAALFGGLSVLNLPPALRTAATTLFTLVGFFQLGVWGSAAVLAWLMVRRKAAAG